MSSNSERTAVYLTQCTYISGTISCSCYDCDLVVIMGWGLILGLINWLNSSRFKNRSQILNGGRANRNMYEMYVNVDKTDNMYYSGRDGR